MAPRPFPVILMAALLPLLCVVALSWPAALDPGLFGDDLKRLAGADTYLTNLAREARWVVHGTNALLGVAPPALAFALCLACWCAACAITAQAICPPSPPWQPMLLALAMAASPGALSLLMWPLSAWIAQAALLATVLGLRLLPPRLGWAGLLVGCIVLSMAHQLLALVAVGMALLIALGRGAGWRGLAAMLAGGGCGIMAGTLAGFTLNAWAFGHFGLLDEPWRRQLLGDDLRGVAAAWQAGHYALAELRAAGAEAFIPLALVTLALGGLALRRQPLLLLAVTGILGVTFALPAATGMPLPEARGTMLLWLGIAALAGFALATRARPAALGLLLALAAIGLPPSATMLQRFQASESANRREMQAILAAAAANAPAARQVVLLGSPERFQGLAGRESHFWWAYFLAEVGTREAFGQRLPVEYCLRACNSGRDWPELLAVFPAPGAIMLRDGVVAVRIGP